QRERDARVHTARKSCPATHQQNGDRLPRLPEHPPGHLRGRGLGSACFESESESESASECRRQRAARAVGEQSTSTELLRIIHENTSIFFSILFDHCLDRNTVPNTLTVIMTAFGHLSRFTQRSAEARTLPCVEQCCADKGYWGASHPLSDSINSEGTT